MIVDNRIAKVCEYCTAGADLICNEYRRKVLTFPAENAAGRWVHTVARDRDRLCPVAPEDSLCGGRVAHKSAIRNRAVIIHGVRSSQWRQCSAARCGVSGTHERNDGFSVAR